MAERGPLTLAFGPMKPVGLADRRSGPTPFAVVQLRQEDKTRHALQPGRLPDQDEARASRSASSARCRAWRTPCSRASAPCTATPSSARPSCSTSACSTARARGCTSRARWRAWRATSSRPRSGLLAGIFVAAKCARRRGAAAAADHGARRALAPPARGRPAPLPADERELRPVPAARRRRRARASARERNARIAERALADLEPWTRAIGAAPVSP